MTETTRFPARTLLRGPSMSAVTLAVLLALPGRAAAAPGSPPPPRASADMPSDRNDDAMRSAEQLRKAGATTVIVSASVAALGSIITPIGAVVWRRNVQIRNECLDGVEQDGCDHARQRAAHGGRLFIAGAIVANVAILATIAGAITWGVGRARVRRATRMQLSGVSLAPMRDGIGVGAAFRF